MESKSHVLGDYSPVLSQVEVDDVPSRKLPYGKNAVISYRPYTFRELDIFNDSTLSADERIKFILAGMFIDGGEASELTLPDFLYLGLLRKISSLGTAKFTVTLPDSAASRVLDFSDINFDYLEVPELPVSVTLSDGGELDFMPLTVGRYLENKGRDRDNERSRIAMQCVNLDREKAQRMVDDATGRDLLLFTEVDKLLFHGVLPVTLKFKDKGNERSASVEIDDPRSLVWPFRGDEDSVKNSIRFGVQERSGRGDAGGHGRGESAYVVGSASAADTGRKGSDGKSAASQPPTHKKRSYPALTRV